MKSWILAAATIVGATSAQAVTVVTADRMLDVRTGRYVDHPVIVVGDDGKVQQIDSGTRVNAPAGTKRIGRAGGGRVGGGGRMGVGHRTWREVRGGWRG